MASIVYRIHTLLEKILQNVPLGTNLGFYHLFLTILSGRLLNSRGALFPALADFGLDPPALRRAEAALYHGRFQPHGFEGSKPCSLTCAVFVGRECSVL